MTDVPLMVTTAYPSPLIAGDIIEIQGSMNAPWNTRLEVLSVRSGNFLTLRPVTLWALLRTHFRSAWQKFRWAVDDAYLELCDLWDEAKEDWRKTRR